MKRKSLIQLGTAAIGILSLSALISFIPAQKQNAPSFAPSFGIEKKAASPYAVDISKFTLDHIIPNGEIITGTLQEYHRFSIADGAEITLEDLTIDIFDGEGVTPTRYAGLTCEGNATINLKGTNKIVALDKVNPAIYVPYGHTLTINGIDGGSLLAMSYYGAGIGGGENIPGGSIVINSGNITSIGGGSSAGIGASYQAVCQNITINGGTVNATGGGGSPGIGTGRGASSECGNIAINGGTVNATGGNLSVGIGAGDADSGTRTKCGTIDIGRNITRVTATNGDGVPSGHGPIGSSSQYGTYGAITISHYLSVETSGNPTTSVITPLENFNLTYNGNGNTSGTAPSLEEHPVDSDVTVKGNPGNLKNDGYFFLGWNTKADGTGTFYKEGDELTLDENLTLYAQWRQSVINLSSVSDDLVILNGQTISGTLAGLHKISIEDGAMVILNNVTINGTDSDLAQFAGITCLGDATLIIEGDNSIKGFQANYPGIYVAPEKTLSIFGNGNLSASSGGNAAGIGGGYNLSNGNIVIAGGNVTAMGGGSSAGIGSGSENGNIVSSGTISITGGSVTAHGGSTGGAGIGTGATSGFGNTCAGIPITGGSVIAYGGTGAAGIGSGIGGNCGNIEISDSIQSLIATSSTNPIGAGLGGQCGLLTLTGRLKDTAKDNSRTLLPYDLEAFLVEFMNVTDLICEGYDGSKDNHDDLEDAWTILSGVNSYGLLLQDEKEALSNATANENGTAIEQVAARYDFLVGKYGLSNFMDGRTSGSLPLSFVTVAPANNNLYWVLAIALVAMTAVNFSFLIAKREKE